MSSTKTAATINRTHQYPENPPCIPAMEKHTTETIQTVDYIMIGFVLLVTLGIGILFAVKDFRNTNRVEYLLGGRRLYMLPVALSIFATFTSGVSFLGITTEAYLLGLMAVTVYIGVGIGYLCAVFTIAPLMYPLRLTSLYEYLQLRFDSSAVRMFAVVIGMLQTLSTMAIVLMSPALALQTGVGLPMWISVGLLGGLCTVYTAIGGIKTVIWTDAFQCCVMLTGLLTVIVKGSSDVGGGQAVWEIVKRGGRDRLNDFSFDPRIKYTWWGATIGVSVLWLATICNQSSLQRISSMRSLKDARRAFLLSAILVWVCLAMFGALAFVTYAYFVTIRCDPIQAGFISNRNQVSPYFIMHAMKDLPGIRGVYLAALFSASLSTISSGINSLAANTVEDVLRRPLRNVQEGTVTSITKGFVFVYGGLITGLAFGASSLQGPITHMFVTILGAWGGPILGIFCLGGFFPWANKYGAIGGGVTALVFNMWIAIGNQMYGRKLKTLPPAPIDMCFLNSSATSVISDNVARIFNESTTLSFKSLNNTGSLSSSMEGKDPFSFGFFFYDVSHEWFALIGTLVSLLLGLAISRCSQRHCKSATDEKYIVPIVRKFWFSKLSQDRKDEKDEEEMDGLMTLPRSDLKHVTNSPESLLSERNI